MRKVALLVAVAIAVSAPSAAFAAKKKRAKAPPPAPAAVQAPDIAALNKNTFKLVEDMFTWPFK